MVVLLSVFVSLSVFVRFSVFMLLNGFSSALSLCELSPCVSLLKGYSVAAPVDCFSLSFPSD